MQLKNVEHLCFQDMDLATRDPFFFPPTSTAMTCPYPVPGSPRQPPHEERQVQSAPPERQPFDEEVRGGGGATVTIYVCSPGGSLDPFDIFVSYCLTWKKSDQRDLGNGHLH